MEKQRIEELYERGKKFINKIRNQHNYDEMSFWLEVGINLAQMIDKYSDIEGIEKKDIVLTTTELLIADKDLFPEMSEKTRNNIHIMVRISLPSTIDLVVKATKGDIEINKKLHCLCFTIQ